MKNEKMNLKRLIILLIFNLILFAIILTLYSQGLNKIMDLELSGKDEALRAVRFMNIYGNYVNLTLIVSLILLTLNIFLSRNWIRLKYWILIPVLIFISMTPIMIYLEYFLIKSYS
jgi:hypothetical protein